MPSQLPPKENTLFKRILKCYEQKQYKNGLKFCKQILSNPKFADHGETLAMKGLTLNYLGRKDEAYDYAKRGLMNDLSSHVCWHVFGLLQRADHKYDEAIKCYRNALKWDKDNIQILRDLSLLQVQMRDTEGFRDTRYQLLKIRPAQRQSWIGYSISYYLLGDYDMAFTIIEEFRKTLFQDNQSKMDIEHSEMLFYQNMLLREQGKIDESLQHLDTYENKFTDKLQVQEIKGLLKLQLDHAEEAKRIYEDLIKRNPENHNYYDALEKCVAALSGINNLFESEKLAIYLKYKKKYPRAETPRALPLTFTTGSVFHDLLKDYLTYSLKKGIPTLFTNLKPLYGDKTKVNTIETTVLHYENNLKSFNKFNWEDADLQSPTELLWTKFFLAQHYDYVRNIKCALLYIDEVLTHTPTLIEGYMVKAKILKHAGCLKEAAQCMDEGRSLDTADRYVNSKSAKYFLRANEIGKAVETIGMFTKEGTLPDEDLDSMQCMWFGSECAAAHRRRGEIGEALRKCHQIERNFNEIVEDQFDFHTYCMRKVTLCAYIKLLKLEDVLRSHRFYFEAARIAIECYIRLYDKPYNAGDEAGDAGRGNMSEKELKKLKNKQRRAQKKQQIEKEKKVNTAKDTKDTDGKKEDAKLKINPDELVKCDNPLDEAVKFLTPLQNLAKERIETHLMAFEIYYRKGKLLLMLQSIKRAFKCNPADPTLHECIIKFLAKVKANHKSFNGTVKSVLDTEVSKITKEDDLVKYNESYLQMHPFSLKAHIAVGKSLFTLDPSKKDEAIDLITKISDRFTDVSLKLCLEVCDFLTNGPLKPSQRNYNDWFKNCRKLFPLADKFNLDASKEEKHNLNVELKECSPDILD